MMSISAKGNTVQLQTVEDLYFVSSHHDWVQLYQDLVKALQDEFRFTEDSTKLILKFINRALPDEGFYTDCVGFDQIRKLCELIKQVETN